MPAKILEFGPLHRASNPTSHSGKHHRHCRISSSLFYVSTLEGAHAIPRLMAGFEEAALRHPITVLFEVFEPQIFLRGKLVRFLGLGFELQLESGNLSL